MATSDTKNTGRLIDWIILVFVLIVMGLLIADLGSNVVETSGQHRKLANEAADTGASPPSRRDSGR